MSKFGEKIRRLAEKLGKEEQQIAKELNLTKSQLSHYINGNRKVPSDLLQKIVDKYSINPLFLFRENEPLYEGMIKKEGGIYGANSKYTFLPTSVSAGLPLTIDGIQNADKISIPDEIMGRYVGQKDIFILRINGDSMNRVIPHNSLVAIKPTPLESLKNDDIVLFSDEHDYSIKRYSKYGETLVFKPDSTNEKHIEQTYEQNENIKIHGKVVIYIVEQD